MCGLNNTDFNRRDFYHEIYDIVAKIPVGRVLTYGLLARLAGKPQYSRLAGQALAQIPADLSLPCHRIVNSQGRTAPHWPEQRRLLEEEGITFKANGCIDLHKYLWNLFQK